MARVRRSSSNNSYISHEITKRIKDDLFNNFMLILIIIISSLLGYLIIGRNILKYLYSNFIFKNKCAMDNDKNSENCKNVSKTEIIIRNLTTEGFIIYLLCLAIIVVFFMIIIKIFLYIM